MFYESDKCYDLGKDYTVDDIVKTTIKAFEDKLKDDWFTSRKYTNDEVIKYKSKPTPKKLLSNQMAAEAMIYCDHLFRSLHYKVDINSTISAELNKAEEDGLLCTYISCILYCLLIEYKAAIEDELKFVQGFYIYPTRTEYLNLFNASIDQVGVHAWVSYMDSVLDFSIGQISMFFDFKDRDHVIIGEIPEGLKLYGFEEPKTLVKKYARKFAKFSGMNYYEWISFHKLNSDKTFLEYKIKAYSDLKTQIEKSL